MMKTFTAGQPSPLRLPLALLLLGVVVLALPTTAAAQFDLGGGDDPPAAAPEPPFGLEVLQGATLRDELKLNNEQRQKFDQLWQDYQQQETKIKEDLAAELKGITSLGERLRKKAEQRDEERKRLGDVCSQIEPQIRETLNDEQFQTYSQRLTEATPEGATSSSTPGNSSSDSASSSTPSSGSSSTPGSGTSSPGPSSYGSRFGSSSSGSGSSSSSSSSNSSRFMTTGPTVASFAVAQVDNNQANNQAANAEVPVAPAADGAAAGAANQAGNQADNAPPTQPGVPAQKKLSFSFRNAPWPEVLKLFADAAGLTLHLRDVPPGEFSYFDRATYTPTEALDIMNRFLLQHGYILVRHDRFLTVFNTKDGVPPNLIDTVTVEELADRGSTELLRVMLPLGDRNTEKASSEVRNLLGPQGQVSALESANSLVVTDIASNLRRIQRMLEPPPKVAAADLLFRAFPLNYVRADDAMEMVNRLFGIANGIQNVSASADDSRGSSSRGSSSRGGFDPRAMMSRFGGGGGRDDDNDDRRSSSSSSSSAPPAPVVSIAVDDHTNSLLVRAQASDMKIVEQAVEAIDVPGNSTEGLAARAPNEPYLEVYKLKDADAREVSKTLSVLHPGNVVNEDGRNDMIHIWGTAEQQRQIAAHIRQLDGLGATDSIAVVPLRDVHPEDASSMLASLFLRDQATAPALQVAPDGRHLIVRGTIAQIDQIRTLLDNYAILGGGSGSREPDYAYDSQSTVRIIRTQNSTALADTVRSMFPQVTVSTTSPVAQNESSRGSRSGSNGGSSGRSSEDEERAERIRRFMEMRDRFMGGSSSGGGPPSFGRSSSDRGGSDRGGSSRGGRD